MSDSQHPHGRSQVPVIPPLGLLITALALVATIHTCCADTHKGKTLIHITYIWVFALLGEIVIPVLSRQRQENH